MCLLSDDDGVRWLWRERVCLNGFYKSSEGFHMPVSFFLEILLFPEYTMNVVQFHTEVGKAAKSRLWKSSATV